MRHMTRRDRLVAIWGACVGALSHTLWRVATERDDGDPLDWVAFGLIVWVFLFACYGSLRLIDDSTKEAQ